MERTTTCIPCVPSILEGFRRSGTSSGSGGKGGGARGGGGGGGGGEEGGGGGGDRNGTDGGENESRDTLGNGGDRRANQTRFTIKVTKSDGTNEGTAGSNALASNGGCLPSLSSLSSTGSTLSHRIHPLRKGKTSLGCSSCQDIVIEGASIDDQHCYIINEGQVVTFYPLAILNSVDGFRVTKPTRLCHGSVLCFGHSVYFRFNYPQQKSKTDQKIIVKGSSPGCYLDDENRRRLIKLQSKPSAQEESVTRSSFNVPDASQFHWVDFDKELGLKLPVEQRTAPHVRSVRTSLPSSSHSRDVRVSRGRFPSQSLEIYPKENSECESPSPAFLSSPPGFPHDPPKSGADSKFPQPVNGGKNHRRLNDESDSGTHSTDTSSLSGSSHGSGVKVSLIEHVRLDVRAHDRKEPHRTRLNIVPGRLHTGAPATPSSVSNSAVTLGTNSSSNLCRYSGGYDNIANIKAAIIAAATAKLASPPLSSAENAAGRRPESLRLSIVSQSDLSPRDTAPTARLENSSSAESSAQSEKCITDRTGKRCETLSQDLPGQVPLSSSEYSVKLAGSDEKPDSQEVLADNPFPPAAHSTLVVSDCKGNTDVNVVCDRDLDSIPAVSSSTSKSNDITGSIEPSNPVEKTFTCVKNDSGNTKEENSVTLTPESPLVEDCVRTTVICSNKPPIGKSVPEAGKVIKIERKSLKPDKKSSEPAAAAFKSLLSRSRSPSPKGRAGNSSGSSSTKESRAEHLNQAITSLLLQTETDEIQDSGERVKACSEDDSGSIVTGAEQTHTAEKLSSGDSGESPENPWRVNLRQSLRPNLENFKGEKVFTKDTVTTTVFIGVGLDGSCTSPTRSEASVKEPATLPAKTSKSFPGISDSARDLRVIQSSEQPAHADVDFGYISDSGLSVAKDLGRIGKYCRQKGKKCVTFAEEYGKGSSILEKDPGQLPPDISPNMAQNMDRVVEGRSPTEKVSISENVKTYLEMVNSSWQKGKPAGDEVEPASESQVNRTKNQNGFCDSEAHDVKKSKSEVVESNEFGQLSEFNNNSSNGSDVKQFGNGKVEVTDERQSVGLDELDLEDLGASQQDLKQLYQLQRSERLEEQRRAEVEKQRLEEILKMCSEFGVNTDLEKDEKHEPSSSTDRSKTLNSSSSNSEDDAAERNTIKRRPVFDKSPIFDKSIPATSQILDPSPLLRLESSLSDSRVSSATAGGRAVDEDLSPASPVVDSGIDISSTDRPFAFPHSKEFGSAFRRSSEERRPSLDRLHSEDWSAGEYQPHHLTNDAEYLKTGYPGKRIFHKVWSDEKSKQVQLDLLGEMQRDVVRRIADIKQKISDIETRQREAVREVEMERALLEGEQQIQMEQLDGVKEKIAALEAKDANLLAEAALQRAMEVEKIHMEKEKLLDLEHQLHAVKDLTSRTTNADDTEALKKRCSEVQDAVENHRFLVDNLEFQQLEVEAHFEEEKESVQKELMSERAYLDSLSSQHQATLQQIASQQSDLLKQVDFDVFELEKERQGLAELFQKENTVLYNINCQIQDALSSSLLEDDKQYEDVQLSYSNRWHRPRLSEAEMEAASRSSHGSPQKLPAKFSHTIPKIDPSRIRHGGETSDDEDRRFLYELKKRSASRLIWERSCDVPDGGGVGGDGALTQWQVSGSSAPTGNSESEDSSISGSDPLSDKAISLSSKEDQLHDMECLLVLAKAEGLRLVEEQMHQRDIEREALELERRRRKELERRLAEEIAKHNDVIEQAIRLREKEKLQARPLTRYLPVRDRSLDLLQFIVAAGHSVDQCTHLAMTSTSCRGYLTKMGGRIRTWKKRWFVFDRTKRCLSYHGDRSESRPRGVVYFQAIEDVFVDHLHQVKSPTPQLTFCVKTYDRMYYLMAPSPDAMRIWIDVIFTGAEGYQQFA